MTLGELSSYVVATLLPGRTSTARTATAQESGFAPRWEEKLQLPADDEATHLLLEVYAEGMVSDEIMGKIEIPLSQDGFGNKKKDTCMLDTGGKLQCAVMCTVNALPPPKLHVLVEEATELPLVSMFGSQDPYVKVTIIAAGTHADSGTTNVIEDGGCAPKWAETLKLKKSKDLEGVLIEVFHSSVAGDQLIGSAMINVLNESFGSGGKIRKPLDNGGKVLVRITNSDAPSEKKKKSKKGAAPVLNGDTVQNGTSDSAAAAGEHMLALTVLNAIDLPTLSMFVANQPYVKASIMIMTTEDTKVLATARSAVGEVDGTHPKWEDGPNRKIENRLQLACGGDAGDMKKIRLVLEVWDQGDLGGDTLLCTAQAKGSTLLLMPARSADR
jgi:hypothetical protein